MQKLNKPLSIVIFILFIGCGTSQFFKQTTFLKMEKTILKEEYPEQFFYWELDNTKQLWESELGETSYLNQYKDSLKMELGEEGLDKAIKNEQTQNIEKYHLEKATYRDTINALLVHNGTLGKIRKINYLEAQILNYQLKRFPLFSHPTEFHSFIATNENEQKIRIYFCSSDTEWPPKPKILIAQLEKDMEKGWKLKYHLHNHFCKKDKNYIGILAPSLADAQYFKMLAERFNLSKALITNGFHSVELDAAEFDQFESH